jgi:hypothetical protein
VDLVNLPNEMNWVMRPVEFGYCDMKSLRDGSLGLEDLAIMNDAIEARLENERRMHRKRPRG